MRRRFRFDPKRSFACRQRFILFTQIDQRDGHIAKGIGIVRHESYRFAVRGNRFKYSPLAVQHIRKVVMRLPQGWIEPNGLFARFDCLVEPQQIVQDDSQIHMGFEVVRFQFDRPPIGRERLIKFSHPANALPRLL